MSAEFYPLTVSETRAEIGGEAKTLLFDVPHALADRFKWRAGQHLSLRVQVNGQAHRRSYSISASPFSGDPLRITVKRVKGGVVSTHINDAVTKGDVIEVMAPFGSFCLDSAPNLRRTHYFFGAGSGITPLYAMLHSVLCNEPHSVAHLAYGNKSAKTVLLAEELAHLSKTYGPRLSLRHVLSAPGLWSGFDYWRKGRLDAQTVGALIDEHPPYAQDAQYYICGPGGMNGAVKTALIGLDVPPERIHMESYGAAGQSDVSVKGRAAQAQVTLKGAQSLVPVGADQTLLEAARQAGLNPPFSCQSGVCGACRARVRAGRVHMRARMALEDAEIAEGSVLTCQAVALSETLSLSYDP